MQDLGLRISHNRQKQSTKKRTLLFYCYYFLILAVSNEPQANKKFFAPAIFQKCWRGVGEQPTFAEQIKLHNEMKQKSKNESEESQLPLEIKRL